MLNTKDMAWSGWLRLPGGRWKTVVQAATEDEAWRLVHQRASVHMTTDVCVMPTGRNPYERIGGSKK